MGSCRPADGPRPSAGHNRLKASNQGAVGFGGAAGNGERNPAKRVPGHLEEFFHLKAGVMAKRRDFLRNDLRDRAWPGKRPAMHQAANQSRWPPDRAAAP